MSVNSRKSDVDRLRWTDSIVVVVVVVVAVDVVVVYFVVVVVVFVVVDGEGTRRS